MTLKYDPSTGKRLQVVRELFGYSQREVAERCGIDRATYSKIEAGRATLTIHQGLQVAAVLQVTLDYLYLGKVASLPVNLIEPVTRALDAGR